MRASHSIASHSIAQQITPRSRSEQSRAEQSRTKQRRATQTQTQPKTQHNNAPKVGASPSTGSSRTEGAVWPRCTHHLVARFGRFWSAPHPTTPERMSALVFERERES
eukprot:1294780-Rhodomonas_salina.2